MVSDAVVVLGPRDAPPFGHVFLAGGPGDNALDVYGEEGAFNLRRGTARGRRGRTGGAVRSGVDRASPVAGQHVRGQAYLGLHPSRSRVHKRQREKGGVGSIPGRRACLETVERRLEVGGW